MDSIVQCLIFLCLTTASFSTETGKAAVIYAGHRVVSEGEPFQISCEVTIFDQVRWQKDGQTLYSDLSNNYTFEVRDKVDGVGRLALLSVPSAQTSHSGSYRCNSFSSQSHQFLVLGANEDDDNIRYHFVAYKQSTPLHLECGMKADTGFIVKWYKDDKPINVQDLENKDHFEVTTNDGGGSVLVINRPNEKDLGNYTCQLQDTNSNSSLEGRANHFKVLSELNIRMEATTATVIEGEELKLRCLVISKSPPHKMFWRFGNETYETSRDRVELKTDDKNIPNAIFILKDAVMDDRGSYRCIAYPVPISSEAAKTIEVEAYVRVKDKLAALWPFLGICAEVFVLCAIILIYEKKRNQAELEESDTDQSPDQQKKSTGK